MFFSPFSIAITALEGERADLSAFRTFVRFVLVWICRFPLPLGVLEGLRFFIVALPGLFFYLFLFSKCHLTLIGGRRWTMGVEALAVIASIWSPQDHTATRTKPRNRYFNRSIQFAIIGTSHETGRASSSTTQTASLKWAWSASTIAYGRMFGPSWGRNPRRAGTFSRPGRGSTLKSSSWPTSKTPLSRPSTSHRASPAIRKRLGMHHPPPGLRVQN